MSRSEDRRKKQEEKKQAKAGQTEKMEAVDDTAKTQPLAPIAEQEPWEIDPATGKPKWSEPAGDSALEQLQQEAEEKAKEAEEAQKAAVEAAKAVEEAQKAAAEAAKRAAEEAAQRAAEEAKKAVAEEAEQLRLAQEAGSIRVLWYPCRADGTVDTTKKGEVDPNLADQKSAIGDSKSRKTWVSLDDGRPLRPLTIEEAAQY